MEKQIFINLHVKDLSKSRTFYSEIGFSINEQFSDDTAVSVVIADQINVMLLTYEKFKQFTTKEISDATKTTEVLNALSVGNRDEVNRIVDAAIAAGGMEARPAQDHGFMFGRAFNDPDGHIWEVFWMDASQMPKE